MKIVMKFGGSVLKNKNNIKKIIEIINNYVGRGKKIIIIFSALFNITNYIINMYNIFKSTKNKGILKLQINKIINKHENILNYFIKDHEIQKQFSKKIRNICINLMFDIINYDIQQNIYFNTISKKYFVVYGELLSLEMMSQILKNNNIKLHISNMVNSGIITENNNYKLIILKKSYLTIKENVNIFMESNDNVFLIPGYIASNENGNIVTLGRGGSDYSAVIIAYSIKANKLYFWKNVDGIYEIDPNLMKNIKKINNISSFELFKLSKLGSKIIQNSASKLSKKINIKIYIKNIDKQMEIGTSIKKKKQKENILYITYSKKINYKRLKTYFYFSKKNVVINNIYKYICKLKNLKKLLKKNNVKLIIISLIQYNIFTNKLLILKIKKLINNKKYSAQILKYSKNKHEISLLVLCENSRDTIITIYKFIKEQLNIK